MPRITPHHHPCTNCKAKTECSGTIEQNYDGEPEWICHEFHAPNGGIEDFFCEACTELKEQGVCDNCGKLGPPALVKADVGYMGKQEFCADCMIAQADLP